MSIKNIPTSQNLENTSIKLLQSVLSVLLDLKEENQHTSEVYVDFCSAYQFDLQLLVISFTQSLELGLKSKICSISPFLLLSHFDQDLSKSGNDFLEFRTLNSSQLPDIVTHLDKCELSDKFKKLYKKYNSLRNKLIHLGHLAETLSYTEMTNDLLFCYFELYPRRNIFADNMRFYTKDNHPLFQKDNYLSPMLTCFQDFQKILDSIDNNLFYKIFNVSQKELNFICPHCTSSQDLYTHDFFTFDSPYNLKSCYKINGLNQVYCILCETKYTTYANECDTCGEQIFSSMGNSGSKCLSCGFS